MNEQQQANDGELLRDVQPGEREQRCPHHELGGDDTSPQPAPRIPNPIHERRPKKLSNPRQYQQPGERGDLIYRQPLHSQPGRQRPPDETNRRPFAQVEQGKE
jgi:hypothetical protein